MDEAENVRFQVMLFLLKLENQRSLIAQREKMLANLGDPSAKFKAAEDVDKAVETGAGEAKELGLGSRVRNVVVKV